jgi:hypothetical protein
MNSIVGPMENRALLQSLGDHARVKLSFGRASSAREPRKSHP